MATTAVYPGSSNTYVPQATDQYVVDFSRNVKTFAHNRWAQIVNISGGKTKGYYPVMTVEECARVLNANGADVEWPDGAARPQGNDGRESFSFQPYNTHRYAFSFNLGDLSVEQASWDIVAQHGRIHAQRAMTQRTQFAVTQAITSGNYASTHRSAVSSITGNTGKWDVSTPARQDIRNSINFAADRIFLDTAGTVQQDQLILVISKTDARLMAKSQELVDYIKGSPDAKDYIKGNLGLNAAYGLPSHLYGVEVVVEDAVKVTSRKGATLASSYVLPSGTAFMCSRVGGLEGVEGPNFSTHVLFMKEEMTVEQFRLNNNMDRRLIGSVAENYQAVAAATVTGFLFTAATG